MYDGSSLLPLIDPAHQSSPRRSRSKLQLSDIIRCITRRRLKFYIFASVLVLIFLLTLLHRASHRGQSGFGHDHETNHERKRARLRTRTMKTIVGKYVGPRFELGKGVNLSEEILNANNYEPDPNAGKDGRPVYLPGYPRDQMQALYSINSFNLAVSDKISVDRRLPDARKPGCRRLAYNTSTLAATSVIIVFHNEAWSTLARTVHSILNTADRRLLAEILLVDDASERAFLGKSLDNYMINLSSSRGVDIRVLRSSERIGLIRARLLGVARARGQVLTFMDAHCEATTGWLEPLLEQVRAEPHSAACPIIDIINEDTFAYSRSFELHLGAFNWGLNFRWYPISRRELRASNGRAQLAGAELVRPFSSPVMAGGLFSIRRDYFERLGAYDEHMDIWGGENIELSLRLWQCGGQVKIVPCSHVAHLFRKSSPYSFRAGREVGDVLYANLARLAEVWLDEWREFFYAMNQQLGATLAKLGRARVLERIDERKRLRARLNCRPFKWFLDSVWPEHFLPALANSHQRLFGQLSPSSRPAECLERPRVAPRAGQAPVGALTSSSCNARLGSTNGQLFVYDRARELLMSDENVCLDSGSDPVPSRQAILAPCTQSERQKWLLEAGQLRHKQSGLCLSSPRPQRVQLDECHAQLEPGVAWHFRPVSWTNSSSALL